MKHMLRLVHEKKKAIEKYRKEDFGEHEKAAVVLPSGLLDKE